MLNDIYNKRIIELAGNIPRLGRLPTPDASATAHSKLCGSTVKIDLKMDGPVVDRSVTGQTGQLCRRAPESPHHSTAPTGLASQLARGDAMAGLYFRQCRSYIGR